MMAPTLIIGLGGIGSEIVSMVEQKCKAQNIDTFNMKFVLMDTDIAALNKLKDRGFDGTIIKISRNMTVSACLKLNQNAKTQWYPQNGIFNNKTLTEGAGQVRAISRLALEDAIRCGEMDALKEDIHILHETHRNIDGKTLRIAIVSSLAGGTGAGIILPLGVYIGRYLEEKYPGNGYNMSGFFMLPDILMMTARESQTERESLNSNAYAALKELDAYIQGVVGTTDQKINISFGEDESDKTMPAIYNFSFLFGDVGKSKDNVSYTLHDIVRYKEMMANSIYLPYCSPINEINSSREDNKFKHLAILLSIDLEKKYRYFGSIGVSRIIYPYCMVRKYLTMLWVQDVMENSWFQYDNQYEEELKKHHEKVKSGKKNGAFMGRREFYLHSVEKGRDAFSEQIINNLNQKGDNSPGDTETVWETYVDRVEKYIKGEVEEGLVRNNVSLVRAANMQQKQINSKRVFVGKTSKRCKEDYEKLFRALYTKSQEFCQKLQVEIAECLNEWHDKDTQHDKNTQHDYYLEYWITEKPGGALYNPNTMRYFIGKVYEVLCVKIQQYEAEKEERRNKEDNQSELIRKTERFGKRELRRRLQNMTEESLTHWIAETVFFVMHAHMEYIRNLYENFETLFDEFRRGMDELKHRKYLLENELFERSGNTENNICCDRDTLGQMFEKMKEESTKYYGESNRVYAQIYRFAADMTQPARGAGAETADKWEVLLNEWEGTFQQLYGGTYDMDVISAMEWQEKAKKNSNIKAAIERVIDEAREKVGMPFLNVFKKPEQSILSENYFHSSLLGLEGEKGEIVAEELIGKDGIDEKTVIDRYTIYFYKSLFGLHISELPQLDKLNEYYKDYRAVTRNIHLNADKNQILTPHIDKSWHRPDVLPEITERRQRKVQTEVWKALIYGLIDGGADSGMIWKDGKEYCIQASSIVHSKKTDLNKVEDLLQEFPDDRFFILESMKKNFQKRESVYTKDKFYKEYCKINLIEDVFCAFFKDTEETEESEMQVEYFLCAWESILYDFLSSYLRNPKDAMKEMINLQRTSKNPSDECKECWAVKLLNKLLEDRGYSAV